MGSAVSTLFAYALASARSSTRIVVVALASPRVGAQTFKSCYNACTNIKHFSVQNHRDIVGALPSWGYVHVGTVVRFSGGCWTVADDGDLCLSGCYSLRDHGCRRYLKAMTTGTPPADGVVRLI